MKKIQSTLQRTFKFILIVLAKTILGINPVNIYRPIRSPKRMTKLKGKEMLFILEYKFKLPDDTFITSPYFLDYSTLPSVKIPIEFPSEIKYCFDSCLISDNTILITEFDTKKIYEFKISKENEIFKTEKISSIGSNIIFPSRFRYCQKDYWAFSKEYSIGSKEKSLITAFDPEGSSLVEIQGSSREVNPIQEKETYLVLKMNKTIGIKADFVPGDKYKFQLSVVKIYNFLENEPGWKPFGFDSSYMVWNMDKVTDSRIIVLLNRFQDNKVPDLSEMKLAINLFYLFDELAIRLFRVDKKFKQIENRAFMIQQNIFGVEMKPFKFRIDLYIVFIGQRFVVGNKFTIFVNFLQTQNDQINFLLTDNIKLGESRGGNHQIAFSSDYKNQFLIYSFLPPNNISKFSTVFKLKLGLKKLLCYGQYEGKFCRTCTEINNKNKCSSCFEGYFLEGEKCIQCSPFCSKCENLKVCEVCDEGHELYKDEDGDMKCSPNCGQEKYFSSGVEECESCSNIENFCGSCSISDINVFPSKMKCDKCDEKSMFLKKKCICNHFHYLDPEKNECIPKEKNCVKENPDTGICEECTSVAKFNPDTKLCEMSCNQNQFINFDNSKCLICQDTISNCIRCEDFSGKCLGCLEGNYFKDQTQKECSSCISKTIGCERCEHFSGKCYQCFTGYFYNEEKKICQKKCNAQEAWVEPNDCQRCLDENCKTCFNMTRKCKECSPNFNISKEYEKFECKRNCDKNGTAWNLDTNSCLSCKDKCMRCENVTFNCLECEDETYWINLTSQCQKKCQGLESWIYPNQCSPCKVGCYECKNVTLECMDKEVESTIFQVYNKSEVFDVTLYSYFRYKNESIFEFPPELNYTYFYKASFINDTNASRILADKKIIGSYSKRLPNNTIETNFNLTDKFKESYNINIELFWNVHLTSNITGESIIFKIKNMSLVILNEEILEMGKLRRRLPKNDNADFLANAASTSSKTSEVAGYFAGVLFSPESGGSFMSSIQVLKIYNRLRYLNIDFGERLTPFLTSLGQIFKDTIDEQDTEYMYNKSTLTHGKLNFYFVHYTIFDPLGWKPYAYFFSFLMKLPIWGLISWMKRRKKVSKVACYLIFFLRRINMILFSSLLADIYFFCPRTLLHLDDFSFKEYMGSFLLLSFTTYNFLDLIRTVELTKNQDFDLHSMTMSEEEKEIRSKIKDCQQRRVRLEESREGLRFVKDQITWKVKIDQERTLRCLHINKAHLGIITSEVINVKGAYGVFVIRHNLTMFLLRISVYQIMLISMQNLPALCGFLLAVMELAFGIITLFYYCALQHLKNIGIFLMKISQSLSTFIFLVIIYFMAKNQVDRHNKIIADVRIQSLAIFVIVISLVLEVVFLVLKVLISAFQILKPLFKKEKKEGFYLLKGNIFYKVSGLNIEIENDNEEEKEMDIDDEEKEMGIDDEEEKDSDSKSEINWKKFGKKNKKKNEAFNGRNEPNEISINQISIPKYKQKKNNKKKKRKFDEVRDDLRKRKKNKVYPNFEKDELEIRKMESDVFRVAQLHAEKLRKEKLKLQKEEEKRIREKEEIERLEREEREKSKKKKKKQGFLMHPIYDIAFCGKGLDFEGYDESDQSID